MTSLLMNNVRIAFNQRLLGEWHDLAVALDIPAHIIYEWQDEENRGHLIWDWLQARQRLPELPVALKSINRSELAALVEPFLEAVKQSLHLLPEALPYLLNRDTQLDLYTARLQDLIATNPRRPQVVVVHGNAREGHEKLISRLLARNESLDRAGVMNCHVQHIKLHRRLEAEHFVRQFSDYLRTELKAASSRVVDLATALHHGGHPFKLVAIEFSIRSSELTSRPSDSIHSRILALHQFWSQFPDLSDALVVLSFVSVKYDPPPTRNWLARLFTAEPQVELSEPEVQSLEQRADLLLLPRLNAIEPIHIDLWQNHPAVQAYCLQVRIDKLVETQQDLETLFQDLETPHLELVAKRLSDHLERTNQP